MLFRLNDSINNAKPPMSAGPSHYQYGMPCGPPGGPNSENQTEWNPLYFWVLLAIIG